jgi:hypothetical protein
LRSTAPSTSEELDRGALERMFPDWQQVYKYEGGSGVAGTRGLVITYSQLHRRKVWAWAGNSIYGEINVEQPEEASAGE